MVPLADMEAAVIVAPESDDVRRSYAAHATRAGELRGRYVELALESAEAKRRGDRVRAREIDATTDAMLAAHGAKWLPKNLDALAKQPLWSRGFVEHVTVSAPDFLIKTRRFQLLSTAPIRAITFVDAAAVIEELAACPDLERLAYISLSSSSLGDKGASAIAASPFLTRLRALELVTCDIGRPGLDALAASKTLANVRYLALTDNPCGNPVETFDVDETGRIDKGSITLPALGAELEAKYGRLTWLHGPSEWAAYPPSLADVLA